MTWFPVLLAVLAIGAYSGAALYLGRRRTWTGTRFTTTTGKEFQWKVARNKGRPVGSWLGIEAPWSFDFALEREGWFHRVSKSFGFCAELQTGDSDFDRRVFIRSDDTTFQQELSSDQRLHALILEAFAAGAGSIYATPTLLTIQMKTASETPPAGAADRLVDTLAGLETRLAATGFANPDAARSVATWRTAFSALPFFVIASAIAAGISMAVHRYTIVRMDQVLPLMGTLWVALTIGSLIVIRFVFHRSSYGHGVLRNFLVALLPMVAASGFVVAFVNCAYDVSTSRAHVQPIVRKYITHASKGSVSRKS